MSPWRHRTREIAEAKARAVDCRIEAEFARADGDRARARAWKALAGRYDRLARQLTWIPDPAGEDDAAAIHERIAMTAPADPNTIAAAPSTPPCGISRRPRSHCIRSRPRSSGSARNPIVKARSARLESAPLQHPGATRQPRTRSRLYVSARSAHHHAHRRVTAASLPPVPPGSRLMIFARALVQIAALFTIAAIISYDPAHWYIAPAVYACLVLMACCIDLALTASLAWVRRWLV